MQKLGQLMKSEMDTVHRLLDHAEQPRRQYRSTGKPQKPLRARFKADFYFNDGNRCILYSLDYTQFDGDTILNEYEGLSKLYRLIDKWDKAGKLHTASIYINLDQHPLTKDKKYNLLVHRITPAIIRVDSRIIAKTDGTVRAEPLERPETEKRNPNNHLKSNRHD